VRDDAELVGDLRAAEHDRVRSLGVLGEPVEHVELGGDEEAGGARPELGELVDARLLAVHDAEPVGDDGVGEAGELAGERGALGLVLRGLTRVEAQVLEHEHIAVAESGHLGRGILADRVGRERDRGVEQFAEAGRDRRQAVLRVGRPVGTAEVGDDDHSGALRSQGVDRGHRCAHAAVVRDGPLVQRNVEVAADDDALAREVTE